MAGPQRGALATQMPVDNFSLVQHPDPARQIHLSWI